MSLMFHERRIVHLDADAFFASVEEAADPRLRGRPIAVGGEKRGIIASASYEARRFGIYTPMPTSMARRLCPKLILLPGDFEKYELFSRLMFSYVYDFTPEVEVGSIDEGYFDLTGARQSAVGIAENIRRAIRQSLKLPVSEGIASNKLVSQIASKLKKPSAFEFVPHGREAEYLSPLPNKWLPGVGPKTATQLNSAGLAQIGQIAQTPAELLGLLVGRMAPQLRSFALGIDERPIVPVHAPAKSYGEQETFAKDTTDEEFLEATLRRMADKLMAKVREDGKSVRTLTVKVRYNDMDEQQAGESLAEPTDLETDIYEKTSALLRKAWQRRVSLRLVSLKLSNIYDGRFCGGLGLDVSARQHAAQQRLAGVVDQLRQKYGRAVVLRGHDFMLRGKSEEEAKNPKAESRKPKEIRNPKAEKKQSFADTPTAECARPRAQQDSQEQIKESPVFYKKAVVERQRLGNSIARKPPEPKARFHVMATIGAELRFRVETSAPASRTKSAGSSNSPAVSRGHRQQTAVAIPLNVHSYYSFLNSTLSVKSIVEFAKRHELPAIALTDTNNLHGAVEFAQAAAEAGIKPILGAELNCEGRRLCLYVENENGYHNLCRLLSQKMGDQRQTKFDQSPSTNGRGRAPKGLLSPALSSRGGEGGTSAGFADAMSAGTVDAARFDQSLVTSAATRKTSDFGFLSTTGLLAVSPDPALAPFFPDRFYLETNNLEAFEKRPSRLPCVASFPVHYELPADRWKYDVVQSIRTLTLLQQAHPEKDLQGEYHFRSGAELQQRFAAAPELLAHSREIAERCSFTFSLGKPQFPGYTPPDGSTPGAFLYRLVMEGLHRRYPKDHARFKPQLEQELAIITDVGYEEYFLVMWDILRECRRHGIEWITRGSAADSLACYCLGISGVCPIRFDLYFRRFLNKDRMALNKLPDIDVDFPHDRKDDVIDLIFEKYGPEHTAVVGGFSTFQARSAFAEVAKVLGVSDFQVRRITERFPHFARSGELAEAVADTQECRDLPIHEEPYSTALQMAQFLDGFPRYPKMHPCGLVMSRQPMHEITPCFVSAKGYPTTHFDMDSVEAVGLIKMDILAQGGLAVMRDVKEMVEGPGGKGPKKSEIRNPKSEIRKTSAGDSSEISGESCTDRVTEPGSAAFRGPIPLTPALSQRERENPQQCCRKPHALEDPVRRPAGLPLPLGEGWGEGNGVPEKLLAKDIRNGLSDFGFPAPPIDLEKLEPWDDPQVWDLISGGSARAVHHIESPAMISLCKMCNVRDIDTLIAIVSVIRPGAANESKKMEFARRYQGLSPVRYPHPSLERCLRSTYGLVVYEEHILQICEAFAGLPPGRADVLRRALGKNKTELIAQIEKEFARCARQRGRSESEIAEVWALVVGFRGYAFCKAHSTAYGVEAYQSAWLKRYYPVEFMAAVLTNGKGFYSPLVYILECHRLGIPLLPPSVNQPGPQFSVERSPKSEIRNPKETRNPKPEIRNLSGPCNAPIIDKPRGRIPLTPALSQGEREPRRPSGEHFGRVRYAEAQPRVLPLPLGEGRGEGNGTPVGEQLNNVQTNRKAIRVPALLVKGLTNRTKDAIVHERERGEFSSLADFFLRVQPLPEEMEALIRVGAFDEFGKNRALQYWESKSLEQTAARRRSAPVSEQSKVQSPKSQVPGSCMVEQTPDVEAMQLWLLPPGDIEGLAAVPLAEPGRLERLRAEEELLGYAVSEHPLELFPNVAWETYCPINRLGEHLGEQVVTCGLVIEQRLFHQVTGEPMKFLTIADWTGIIETELFARTYQSYGLNTVRYRVLEISAIVEPFENGRGHTLRVLRAGKPREVPTRRSKNQSEQGGK